jgi:hypothetical protein
MLRSRGFGSALLLLLPMLAVSACSTGPSFVVRHEPWRAEEELACLASGLVRETPFIAIRASLGGTGGGSGACGALKPFKMTAAAHGSVMFEPAALVRCPMVHAVDYWTEHVVKPAARRHLGSDVVAVKVASSYACRPINHVSGAYLSEHGHANALDVASFALADGRLVRVKSWWSGTSAERRFLSAVRAGSCKVFTTVLGPGYDALHHDHFHLDLARHRGDGRVCK